jgi:excisionase family DNA binding protein
VRVGTAKDVAALIGASLNKVYELAQTGELPTLRRIGPRLRFDLDQVEQWMREGGQSS